MKTIVATFLLYLTASFITDSRLLAHEDTDLTYKEGVIRGLPDKYSPAFFDRKTCVLKIKGKESNFSPYIKSLFEQEEPYYLYFSASWYHDSKRLPPYIHMELQFRNKDFKYAFLINLNTLEIIDAHVVVQESKNSTRDIPIDISDGRGGKTTTLK